ncbi:MAG: type I-U CRISPR-associated protein Cas8c [Alphaproteobacteria bacterium]|nr:type I-U CRISPR-associated protein Cas8c [Alphaproteobacteria bacterium]
MAEKSIPVDLTNPGQVFACLGFLEAADVLLGEARGGFDWRDAADLRFRLAARGDDDPVVRVLRFLDEARVTSVAPVESPHNTNKWKIETTKDGSGAFPFRDTGPDVLPARLSDGSGKSIAMDHWGDQGRTGRDRMKFWAGAGGYPGAGLARDALDLIRGRAAGHACDPFSLSAEQSSSFRFDWRRDYVPIDAGFSPNAHDDMVMRGYPVVELLAAIGLTNARPVRRQRLEYSYGVAGMGGDELYDPIFLRAALGLAKPLFPGMPFRLFAMRLDWPGQEGQARCITDVIEETPLP